MLTEIEKWALEKGFKEAVLETGIKMLKAVNLYKRNGYVQIPNYGQYADNPDSICMYKQLKKI